MMTTEQKSKFSPSQRSLKDVYPHVVTIKVRERSFKKLSKSTCWGKIESDHLKSDEGEKKRWQYIVVTQTKGGKESCKKKKMKGFKREELTQLEMYVPHE